MASIGKTDRVRFQIPDRHDDGDVFVYLLLEQFATSFSEADVVIVPHIYFVRDSAKERQAVRADGAIDLLNRPFAAPDVDRAALVIAATGAARTDGAVADAARRAFGPNCSIDGTVALMLIHADGTGCPCALALEMSADTISASTKANIFAPRFIGRPRRLR